MRGSRIAAEIVAEWKREEFFKKRAEYVKKKEQICDKQCNKCKYREICEEVEV